MLGLPVPCPVRPSAPERDSICVLLRLLAFLVSLNHVDGVKLRSALVVMEPNPIHWEFHFMVLFRQNTN